MDKVYLLMSWDGHSEKPIVGFSIRQEADDCVKKLSQAFFTDPAKKLDIEARVNYILGIDNYRYGPRWGFEVKEINILN